MDRRGRRRHLASSERAGVYAKHRVAALRKHWLRRAWSFLVGIAAGAVVVAGLSAALLPDEVAPYVIGAVCASGAWVAYLTWLETGGVASFRAGISGEELTIDEVRPLLRRGWRLINHVMLEKNDVDHVMIGAAGLVVLESKFRSRWSEITEVEIERWARKARVAARDVQLRARTNLVATPIIVAWGPRVRETITHPRGLDGVTLCAGAHLREVIEELDSTCDATVAEECYDELDAYVRQRTIGEERELGPTPRAVTDSLLDLTGGVLGGFGCLLAVGMVAERSFAVVAAIAAAFLGASIMARRRCRSARAQAIALGVATTSVAFTCAGLLALLLSLA